MKEFLKKHKQKLIISGGIVGIAVGGIILGKHLKNVISKEAVEEFLKGKNVITWNPRSGSFMKLERVKQILEANAGQDVSFAIVKENGALTDAYSFIVFDDKVIFPAVEILEGV